MKKLTLSALIVIASSAAASAALAQDVAAGKTSFNKCLACHAIGEGAKNKVGPELNGLDGRKSGTAPDYSYSDANKNSGITWNEAQFKEYIKDPKAKIPGTKMAFAGIKNENGDQQSLGVRLAIRQGREDQVSPEHHSRPMSALDRDAEPGRTLLDTRWRYSITSSAVANSVGGIVRPSFLAAPRLTTSSNRVGSWTGKSAGFIPFRIRPV